MWWGGGEGKGIPLVQTSHPTFHQWIHLGRSPRATRQGILLGKAQAPSGFPLEKSLSLSLSLSQLIRDPFCLVNGGFPSFWRKKPCFKWLQNVSFKEPC